jgi:glucose-6-phosphate isomerase
MRAGEAINHTERRAALHIALRHPASKGPILHAGQDVMPAVHAELEKMRRFCAEFTAATGAAPPASRSATSSTSASAAPTSARAWRPRR